MRKVVGPQGLSALAAALACVILSTSSALAGAPIEGIPEMASPVAPVVVSLAAALDRTDVAPYREHAQEAAIAAAALAAHPKPAHPKAKVAHRPLIRNHLWIPALRISQAVLWFPCSRTTAPGNAVYRWGCAGRNNVYLLGHAWGVFKALHDAYLNGSLRKGIVAIYADSRGRIHHYRVTAWQVVSPSNIRWAGSLRTPSMTLQTCIGANSEYRLDVRLVSF